MLDCELTATGRSKSKLVGIITALAAIPLLALASGLLTVCTATEPVDVGAYTIYGPSWDHFDGAAIPADYQRWRLGPFFVIHGP